MTNNCIFTTHHTLTLDHAKNSLWSLLQNQDEFVEWDNFIIYNTQPDVISNNDLVELLGTFDGTAKINNCTIFPYDTVIYKKTLTQDTINHFTILSDNKMNTPGKTLLLKSDYCVSKNFGVYFREMSPNNTFWSLPIYNAKEKVEWHEIVEKLLLPEFSPTDDVTYYRGGTNEGVTPGTMESPFDERSPNGEADTHPSIRFVSHNIQNDYNLHVFSNDLIDISKDICSRVYNTDSTWGGAHELFNVLYHKVKAVKHPEIRAFGVHMFHDIISPNRSQGRTDHRKIIDGERY